MESAKLPITDEVVEKKYDRVNIVLDHAHVGINSGDSSSFNLKNTGSAHNYTITLPSQLKDVVAVTLTGIDINNGLGNSFTLNDSIYIGINDYNLVMTGSLKLPPIFYRITLGTSGYTHYNLSNPTNLGMNTYTYVCDPIVGKLDKFNVRFFRNDGNFYSFPEGTNVIISLTVYCKRNKYSRI